MALSRLQTQVLRSQARLQPRRSCMNNICGMQPRCSLQALGGDRTWMDVVDLLQQTLAVAQETRSCWPQVNLRPFSGELILRLEGFISPKAEHLQLFFSGGGPVE